MRCVAQQLVSGAAALAVLLATPDCHVNAAEGYGAITGRIVFVGEVPILKPIVKERDRTIRDATCCARDDIANEALIVHPHNHGVANVFFFLPEVAPNFIHPDLKTLKKEPVTQNISGCRFSPHAVIVRTNQKVVIKSDDPVAHEVLIQPFLNAAISKRLAPNSPEGIVFNFRQHESFPSTLTCSRHVWMNARWLILDHPYAAISDANGIFTIKRLPAGEHEFNVWHERAGWIRRKHRSRKFTALKVKVVAEATMDVGDIYVDREQFHIDERELQN